MTDRSAPLKAKLAERRKLVAPAPRAPVSRVLPCVDLGARVPGQPCGSQLLRCNRHGDVTTRFAPCSGAQRCCATCADYRTATARPAPIATAAPRPGDPACGVAIGSYKWPELVALQLRVIRASCGAVPVLVSNDHPESLPALAAVCAAHPDVTLDTNPRRIGHAGGDLAVYHKAVRWGAGRALAVVAKLSQRLFLTGPYWLQDAARDLLASGLPVATRASTGRIGGPRYPLRTEGALLDVAAWDRPEVLARIAPAEYFGRRPGGWPAEQVFAELLRDELGGAYWPWAALPTDREAKAPGVVWHNSDPPAAYQELAARHGVALPADFTVAGWDQDLKDGKYLYG